MMKRRTFLASSTVLWSASEMLGRAVFAGVATGSRMHQDLERVRRWLIGNAPKIHTALLPPITSTDLVKLEEACAHELPRDLVALYQWHDGMDRTKIGNLFYGFVFEPAARVVSTMRLQARASASLRYADPGIDPNYSFASSRIPIADDSAHCYLCVDLAPTGAGNLGQIIMVDEEYRVALKLGDSVSALVSGFADDLEKGRYTLAQDALDDGDEWLLPHRSIDPANWFNSPTWARAHAFAK